MKDGTQWVVLDTETDGLCHPIYIVEIAAQRMIDDQPDGEPFQIFLDHGVPIPTGAYAVHGYSQSFLAKNGIDPLDAYRQLKDYVEDRFVCCHNMRYDWSQALMPEWRRLGIDPIGQKGFCTWMLSKRMVRELVSFRLDLLRAHYKLNCSKAHSALGDVESVVDLLSTHLLPQLQKKQITSFEDVLEFSRINPPIKATCLVHDMDYGEIEAMLKERRRLAYEKKREEEKKRDEFYESIHNLRVKLEGATKETFPKIIAEYEFIEDEPEIEFEEKHFLFTGKLKWGVRKNVLELVESLGGIPETSKSINQRINYLILGEDEKRGWTSHIFGGKLNTAFIAKFENPDRDFHLVLEEDFFAAINDYRARNGSNPVKRRKIQYEDGYAVGFKMAVGECFEKTMTSKNFQSGDTIYDTPKAYVGSWGESLKHIGYGFQVKDKTGDVIEYDLLKPNEDRTKLVKDSTVKESIDEFMSKLEKGI